MKRRRKRRQRRRQPLIFVTELTSALVCDIFGKVKERTVKVMFIYSPFSAIRGDFSLSLRHRELEFILENTVQNWRASVDGEVRRQEIK